MSYDFDGPDVRDEHRRAIDCIELIEDLRAGVPGCSADESESMIEFFTDRTGATA